ncbi:50S ribosomal protein L25 [Haloimpatiens sp. FM7330]|uniref:50S ribosomal protein L25 n=1 Tax=Haloimpatiens sp. FM7330 TaxID=3298610 RepID=UPI0036408BAE
MNYINAMRREEKGKKARKNGYIPGVIYGKDIEDNSPVKFKKAEMLKIIKAEGDNAKLLIKLDGEEKYAIIKKIQRNPLNSEEIYNIDIQVVLKDEEIKQSIPVIFTGKRLLQSKGLSLQTVLPQIQVIAKAIDIPKNIIIDVGQKNNGESIKAKEIEMCDDVKIVEEPEAVIASIFYPRS